MDRDRSRPDAAARATPSADNNDRSDFPEKKKKVGRSGIHELLNKNNVCFFFPKNTTTQKLIPKRRISAGCPRV